jgi:hypothetical protein
MILLTYEFLVMILCVLLIDLIGFSMSFQASLEVDIVAYGGNFSGWDPLWYWTLSVGEIHREEIDALTFFFFFIIQNLCLSLKSCQPRKIAVCSNFAMLHCYSVTIITIWQYIVLNCLCETIAIFSNPLYYNAVIWQHWSLSYQKCV